MGIACSTAVCSKEPLDTALATIAGLGFEKIEFLRPTFHGDTIYAETEVLEVRPSEARPDRGVVTVETRASSQREELLMRFRRSVMVPRAPSEEAPAPVTENPAVGRRARGGDGA